jgi:hypothetical protein
MSRSKKKTPGRKEEDCRTDGNAMKAPTDADELTISCLGPTGHVNLLELYAHPNVTIVHLQYQTARHRAITSKEGLEPG